MLHWQPKSHLALYALYWLYLVRTTPSPQARDTPHSEKQPGILKSDALSIGTQDRGATSAQWFEHPNSGEPVSVRISAVIPAGLVISEERSVRSTGESQKSAFHLQLSLRTDSFHVDVHSCQKISVTQLLRPLTQPVVSYHVWWNPCRNLILQNGLTSLAASC